MENLTIDFRVDFGLVTGFGDGIRYKDSDSGRASIGSQVRWGESARCELS